MNLDRAFKFISSFLPNTKQVKNKRFAHPLDYGNVKARDIKRIELKTFRAASPHLVEMEYQELIIDNFTYFRYWCPFCGFLVTEGPEGGGSVNLVCDDCSINYGSMGILPPPASYKRKTPKHRYRRRPTYLHHHLEHMLNAPPHSLALLDHWNHEFEDFKPVICKKGDHSEVVFWGRNGFYLCNVLFEDETLIYYNFTGYPKSFYLSNPKSIERIDEMITKITSQFGDGYYKLLDRTNEFQYT